MSPTTQSVSTLRSLLAQPKVRYLLVGGSVFVLELAVITLAQHAGWQPVPAVGLGYCAGTLTGFILQKFVTFGDRRTHHIVVGLQLLATAGLVVFNLLFSLVVTKLLQDHLPAVVIRTMALLITTFWNFYLYKTRIFKNAPEPIG